jgi:hypothetical protein
MNTKDWRKKSRRPARISGKYSSSISSEEPRITVNAEIYTAQIRALHQHVPMVLAVNVVNSALVALVLASYMEQTKWGVFFGLVVTLTGVRAIGWS